MATRASSGVKDCAVSIILKEFQDYVCVSVCVCVCVRERVRRREKGRDRERKIEGERERDVFERNEEGGHYSGAVLA